MQNQNLPGKTDPFNFLIYIAMTEGTKETTKHCPVNFLFVSFLCRKD